MWSNLKQLSNRRLARYNVAQKQLLLSTPQRTSENLNSALLDALAFVACCATGYMVLVML